jgi:hypothetical protein
VEYHGAIEAALCWLLEISVLKFRAFAKKKKGQKALELQFSGTDIPSSQHSHYSHGFAD